MTQIDKQKALTETINEMRKIFDLLFIPVTTILIVMLAKGLLAVETIPQSISIGLAVVIALLVAQFFRYIFTQIENLNITDKSNNLPDDSEDNNNKDASSFSQHAFDAISTPIFIIDSYSRITIANNAAKKRFSIQNTGIRLEASIRFPEILRGVEEANATKRPVTIPIEHHFPEAIYENIEITPFTHSKRSFNIITFVDETNLRKAEKMRVDFLANAGHELRTPLTSIRGFLETLQGAAKDDEKARDKFINIMVKQAERMSRLINDILSLSRIELNEHLAPKNSIKLNEIVEFAINSTVPIALNNNITLNFTPPLQNPTLIAQDDELQQVIINLIENAIKYGKHNSVVNIDVGHGVSLEEAIATSSKSIPNSASLSLTMPQNINGQTYSYVRVENFGKGINRNYMPRLSERFYRIDDETSLIKGTGLGLAIVKHILNRHRGGLVVESAPNDRTAFTFFVPNN